MALQGKNGGVLAFSGTGLEQAIQEYLQQVISHVPEEIQRPITKVKRIIAAMKDAEQKPISSHEVRRWLQEAKQILLEAEDLFDELATDAAVRKTRAHAKSRTGCQIMVRPVSLFPGIPTRTRSRMRRIHELNDRLDLVASQTPVLGHQISTAEGSCPGLTTWRQTSSLIPDETSVIGRDREREQIIEMLTQFGESSSGNNNNNRGFSIVPIVGLGGMGKTTLAQLVFNDSKVKKHFELMMWVCVSNDADRERVAKDMIEAALAFNGKYEQCQVTAWNSMQRRLLQEVEGKAFLLVLDDVWEAEHCMWEELFKPLHSGKKGSKVLVTARNRASVNKLAGRVETPIPLGGLADADMWVVLKKYAFRGNMDADATTSAECSHLEDLGRCIVRRLRGSPLAARTTGSLLNRELSMQHWKTVLESELWKSEQGKDDILPALLLSYLYLPPDLQQCFAYCSIFSKDYTFSREEVVQLWEAQSFIRKATMGSKYFDDLLHMSFLESKQQDDEDYYVMHDLIHDLAEYVSSDHCFRLEDQKRVEMPGTVRHMSVCVTKRDKVDVIDELCCNGKLRTLLFPTRYHSGVHLTAGDLHQLFLKLKMLRVLGLSRCGIRELPTSIGDLKHLRYIDLGRNHQLTRLPKSLGNLYNLQVLNLKYCGIRELPISIGDLKHLRYMDLRWNYDLESLPESLGKLYNLQVLNLLHCDKLGALPSTMSQLVNLKHLRTDDYELVSHVDGLGKLTGLQELQVRGRRVRELGGMCMLRKLTVHNLEDVRSKEEAIQARLPGMECLQVLQLEWSDRWPLSIKPELEEEVLQALRPNRGIEELHIQGYGGTKSPDWMELSTLSSFSSLRRVSLHDCPNWQVPPSSFLSQLRHLEYLEISQVPECEEWACPVSWECLLELKIVGWPKLKELPLLPPTLRSLHLEEVGVSCLPKVLCGLQRLNQLTLWDCNNLRSLPNLSNVASLETLQICRCPSIEMLEVMSLPASLKSLTLSDCNNPRSLPNLSNVASLETLCISNFPLVETWEVMSLPSSLKQLVFDHLENLRSLPHTLNDCLPSLKTLRIWNCPSLQSLPDTLSRLSSLQTLKIWHCRSIQSWPTDGLPSSLRGLEIIRCPELTGMHKDQPKSMWPEVAHIPHVIIDGRKLE